MSTGHLFKKATKEFFSNCVNYLMLFFGMNIMLFLAVSLFDFLASLILQSQKIPYISYTNLNVFLHKPLAVIGLLLLFGILILTIFFQFAYLLLGVRQIYQRHFNLVELLKESWVVLRKQKAGSFLFFLFYFMLILPFSHEIFNTQLLNKVVIPVFIMDFIETNVLYAVLLGIAGMLIGYIAIRWLFILPLVILGEVPTKTAIQQSLALTKRKFWHFMWRMFVLGFISMALKYFIFIVICILQAGLDQLTNPYPLIGAMINLSLVQLINVIGGAWTSILLLFLLLTNPEIIPFMEHKEKRKTRRVSPRWLNRINITILVGTGLTVLIFNVLYLNGMTEQTPKTISHRGVDSLENPNGVQNTIPSLKKTMKLKPDYVEMDIQETKDGQFVMMHDPELQNLTGVTGAPQQFTLDELTKMTVKEKGLEAKIASFDEYLSVANLGKQKLLIEIKTSKMDSSEMMTNFIEKYKADILKNHHEVQSLDYDVVTFLKDKAPEIPVSYILPYNFVFPNTKSNTYTMESTTLNDTFILKAHATKRTVYAWTINDTETMDKMMFLDVDGIITDELTLLKQEIKEFQDSPNYANRIMNYISVIPDGL